MKIAPVLAAILAGAGLSSASRCRPSASPSVSSASSSSISAPPRSSSSPSSSAPPSSSTSPSSSSIVSSSSSTASSSSAPSSSSPPPASTCGPEAGLMAADTDLTDSSKWNVLVNPAQFLAAIESCNGSPPNGCVRVGPSDLVAGVDLTLTYTARSLVVGTWYTFEFQLSQDKPTAPTNSYFVYTPNYAAIESFRFTQTADTWQTVTFDYQATDPAMGLAIYIRLPISSTASVANLNLYETCPDING